MTLLLVLRIIAMPLIEISMYPGRTKEQKEAFAKAITNAAVEILKTKPEHVIITYDERMRENWYVSGEPL
jgi:4-oxalocrotonate tautomerase